MLEPPKGPPLPSQVGQDVIAEMIDRARATPPGAFLELGVYQGGTAWHLAHLAFAQGRELYLFDTFTGIPYADAVDCHKVGDFGGVDVQALRRALPGCHFITGVFPNSVAALNHMLPALAFVHLDCDQYRSIHDAVAYLTPLMLPGGVMWFDDSPCLEGAKLATRELFGDRLVLSYTQKHYVEF